MPHAQASKRSWNTDETLLRIHILPALGRLTLDQITGEHIAGLINDMRAKGYAGGTTNRVLVLLRYVFNLARKWNMPGASVNPTTGLGTVPEVHRQRFLTAEETQRLIGSIHADKNQIAAKAIMLLLLTGARRREVTRARWEDVDWEKRTLLVPVSKSGKPRTIALNAAAIALLRTAASDSASPYVFPTQLSGLFCPWNRIRRRAGLADVRLHDLRHSFASFLVNQGVSLYVVQGLLGHTQARMTQRYAHLAPQTLLDAAEMAAVVIRPRSRPTLTPPTGFQEPEFGPPTPYLRGLIIRDRASGAAPAKKTPQSQLVAGTPTRRNDLRHTDCALPNRRLSEASSCVAGLTAR